MADTHNQENSRKDDKYMFEGILFASLFTAIKVGTVVLVGAACIGGGYYLYCQKKKKDEQEKQARAYAEQRNKEAQEAKRRQLEAEKARDAEKRQLIDEYCATVKSVDTYRDWNAYKDCFVEIAPFLQLLLGYERSYRENREEPKVILDALKAAIQNFDMEEKLSANGLSVELTPSNYNEAQLRERCKNAEVSAIRNEIKKQTDRILEYKTSLDCPGIVKDNGVLLYHIIQCISADNLTGCCAKIWELKEALEHRGCFTLYYDDEPVENNSMLRVDFRGDAPWATELPGFYTRRSDGSYHRVGTLVGTYRRRR